MNAQEQEEYKAALALKYTPWLGPRTWRELVGRYGSALEAARHARDWRGQGLVNSRQSESFARRLWRAPAEAELESARRGGFSIILWTDPSYPKWLRSIIDPPLFLYAIGRTELLGGPCVSVVGARKCSRSGLEAARAIGEGLSRAGITVVSGMALGIDRQAHLAGLKGVGSSIAVLGTGPDLVYPLANADLRDALAERGLLVTELAPGTRPESRNFPLRNRIISGLSLGTVVVEAAEKSGSLITARLAAEQGREVFALAGAGDAPGYEGCRALVEQGAQVVSSAADIVRELAPILRAELRDGERTVPTASGLPHGLSGAGGAEPSGAPAPSMEPVVPMPEDGPLLVVGSGEEAPHALPEGLAGDDLAACEALASAGRLHIDDLTRTLGWESGRAGRVLVALEIRGVVRKWPGMVYSMA